MYKVGDSGLIVEFINSRLGINSRKFTAETKTKLKQYQASYRQFLKDDTMSQVQSFIESLGNTNNQSLLDNFSYNPYDQLYYKLENPPYKDITHNIENEPEYEIYPNGVCDSWTLQALTEIDIETYDNGILEQVQNVLSQTEYSDNNYIPATGIYNEATKNAIRKFQTKYLVAQEKIPIYEHKNLLSNIPEEWSNLNYLYTHEIEPYEYGPVGNTTTYMKSSIIIDSANPLPVFDSTTLLSPFIAIESGFVYYISIQNSEDYYIKIMFYKYPNDTSGNRIVSLSYNVNQTRPDLDTKTGFDQWLNTEDKRIEGRIYPNYYSPSGSHIDYKINFLRIMIKRKDGGDVAPKDLEKLQIQLEKGTEKTEYEPYSQTVANSFCSGYINIPTYNKIKQIFGIREAEI